LRNLNQIINRLKDFFQLKNETEVAKFLNVEQNTLSSWKKRDKIPYERLDEIALQNKISIEWILSGDSADIQKDEELLRYFNSLSQEKQEIYFLRIKADVLEKNIGLSQK
jgi:transcriptional regulator with XRE-family HTH domain